MYHASKSVKTQVKKNSAADLFHVDFSIKFFNRIDLWLDITQNTNSGTEG